MIKSNYANAMAEVLEYLKGIRDEDIDKIPEEFMEYLKENSSKEYKPNFDYTKPLKELNLMSETKGIICFICYNYWCENQIDKDKFLNQLNENEKKFQEQLREKYDQECSNRINTEKKIDESIEEKIEDSLPTINESKKFNFFQKIINFIKSFKRKS